MRLVAALPCLFAAALLLCGCGASGDERAGSPSDREETTDAAGVPDTARVVCGPDGTRLLAPRVKARPDGVHFVIDNRFEAATGYSFEEPEGGGGGDGAPKGESTHVGDFPPGKIKLGCEKPPADGIGIDYAILKVIDPKGFYKPVELECEGDAAVGGFSDHASGATGAKGDPVELTRRDFSESIENGDVVELAGYPKGPGPKKVRVVRDGRVVAVVEYGRGEGGWLRDNYSACEGF